METYTVILKDGSRQPVYADDYTVEADGNQPYVRFWNEIPEAKDECIEVAIFVLANIWGFYSEHAMKKQMRTVGIGEPSKREH